MKVFISYSRHDAEFVERLDRELTRLGYDVWVDTGDIIAGGQDRWRRSIVAAIRESEATVLVLSPNSTTSENVERELSVAADNGKRVIPITYKPCDLPDGFQYELAGVQRIDFSKTEFQEGVRQLAVHLGPPGDGVAPVAAGVAAHPVAGATTTNRWRQPRVLAIAGVTVALLLIGGIVAATSGGNDSTASTNGLTVSASSVVPATTQSSAQTTDSLTTSPSSTNPTSTSPTSTSPATTAVVVTEAQPLPADPTRTFCVRANIDNAALHAAPGLSAKQIAAIPAGDCTTILLDNAPTSAGNIDWYHVQWNGIDGWTATSLALARCVRADIDNSALRSDPGLASPAFDRIPPGSCNVLLMEPTPTTAGGIAWLHVLWNGEQGWTAESNMA